MKKILFVCLFGVMVSTYSYVSAQCRANAGTDTETCMNEIQLSASDAAPYSGTWTVLEGAASFTNASVYNTTISGYSKGINRLAWTIDSDGCYSSDEVQIIYTPLVSDAGHDDFACTNNSTTLNAKNPYPAEGEWFLKEGEATFENKSAHNTVISNLGYNTYLIWKVTQGTCSAVDEVSILNRTVSISTIYTKDTEICDNQIVLTAKEPIIKVENGNVIIERGEWMVHEGTANFDDKSAFSTRLTNIAQGVNIYQWKLVRDNCTSIDEVIITNHSVQAIVPDSYISCDGLAAFEAPITNNATGTWKLTEGNASISIPSMNKISLSNMQNGTNKLLWHIENGICSAEKTILITNDKVTANAGVDFTTCQSSVKLNADVPAWGNGLWTASSNANVSARSNPKSDITMQNGIIQLEWSVSSPNCNATDNVIITCNYFEVQIMETFLPECLKCNGFIEVTTNVGKSPVNYKWNSVAGNQTTARATQLCAGMFEVLATDALGCKNTARFEFTNENSRILVPEIFGNNTVFSESDKVKYYTNGEGTEYIWDVTGGEIVENKNDTIYVEWRAKGTGTIEMQLQTVCGNVNANSYSVEIKETTNIPPNQNILMPNSVGNDNVFKIRELDECMECYPNNVLQIYTSNGVLVFSHNGYDNSWTGIANQKQSGELPQGTYYYVFQYDKNDASLIKKGYIVLFR